MEIELKYMIPDRDTADRLWQDKMLAAKEEAGTRETVYLKAAYFDTEDGLLSANDIALRVRAEGESTFATLKWAGKNEGPLHTREEINVPVSDSTCLIVPDISLFEESEIGQELIRLIGDKPLFSSIEVGTLRRRFRIDTGRTIIEVSVDTGEIITDCGCAPICEVELELFSGEQDELLEIGEDLQTRYGLAAGAKSKYARGLALLENGKKEAANA